MSALFDKQNPTAKGVLISAALAPARFNRVAQDHTRTKRILCAITITAALLAAFASLSWRMLQDTPVMLYQANLMARHGAMPYRDFFCINLPGSLWMFELFIRLFGISDFTVHVFNALIMLSFSVLIFLAFSKSCRYCALFCAALGALRIFAWRWVFVLERELIALVPIAGLLVLASRNVRYPFLKSIIAGLLLSWLTLIKPQFVLYGIPFVILFWIENRSWRDRIRFFAEMGIAFCVPLLFFFLWIVRNGAWAGFKETLAYWPLYGQMTYTYTFVETATRVRAILSGMWKMIGSPYFIVAFLGLLVGQRNGALSKKQAFLLGGLLVLSVIVPATSGQFWHYHRCPFYYFTILSSGFFLAGRKASTALSILFAIFWIGLAGMRVYLETTISPVEEVKHNVPDAFATYLRNHAKPGDRAQPIDWTYGALHGMLMTDTLPATRFVEFSYFLHSVSTPLIQSLRKEFLTDLEKRPPRFLLEVRSEKWPNGIDAEKHFQAFEDWRDVHYHVAEQSEHYCIWEYRGK